MNIYILLRKFKNLFLVSNYSSIVFTHIPKCAGNSVISFYRNVVAKKDINMISIVTSCSVSSRTNIIKEIINNFESERKDFQVILGHIPFQITKKMFPNSLFTTLLRNPAEQLISSYCSQGNNITKKDFGMSTFIKSFNTNINDEWAIDNIQVRMLCNDFRFGKPVNAGMLKDAKNNLIKNYFFEITDNIDNYFNNILKLMDAPMDLQPMARLNSTGNYTKFINSQHLLFAQKVNNFDFLLYSWAKKIIKENKNLIKKPIEFKEITLKFKAIKSPLFEINTDYQNFKKDGLWVEYDKYKITDKE